MRFTSPVAEKAINKFCYNNAWTYWISIVLPVIKVKYCWYFIKIFSLIWTGLIELLSWTKFCSNLIISSCGRLSWNCIYNFPISPWLHYTIFALPLLYITEITGGRGEQHNSRVETGEEIAGKQPNQQPDYNISSHWTTWPQLEKSLNRNQRYTWTELGGSWQGQLNLNYI